MNVMLLVACNYLCNSFRIFEFLSELFCWAFNITSAKINISTAKIYNEVSGAIEMINCNSYKKTLKG